MVYPGAASLQGADLWGPVSFPAGGEHVWGGGAAVSHQRYNDGWEYYTVQIHKHLHVDGSSTYHAYHNSKLQIVKMTVWGIFQHFRRFTWYFCHFERLTI